MTAVYVIAAESGPVKVGMAKDPKARLRELRTGTPYRLHLMHTEDTGDLNARKVEAAAHILLEDTRTQGEWFDVTPDIARDAIRLAMQRLRAGEVFISRAARAWWSILTPAQCRAARGLLDWTQARLAAETKLSSMTIRAFEGGREARESNLQLIRLIFEGAGVIFIPENGDGPGVKLRKAAP